MAFFLQYIPGTQAYQVARGLRFAEYMIMPGRQGSAEAFVELRRKVLECQSGNCPYDGASLRDLAHRICPGLGHVSSVRDMVDAVTDK